MYRHWIVVALVLAAVTQVQAQDGLRAGAFAQDVTPLKFPVSVNGNMTDIIAHGAHDRLHARCLVLDDGKTKLAFAVVDNCLIPRELMDAGKTRVTQATGVPTSNILISATHTHTAPAVAGIFQSGPNADYVKLLEERIAEGITKAHARLEPAQIGWGVVQEPGQLFNRRWLLKPGAVAQDPFGGTTDRVKMNPGHRHPDIDRPAGPTDPDVSVLSVRARDGKPLAVLANYSLHYVGGVPPLSADYFGMFAEQLATRLGAGPEFVAIMSNGTSGDVNNINFGAAAPGKRQPGEQARHVAGVVAEAARKACVSAQYRSDVTLAAAERELELGVRKADAVALGRARDLLEKAKGRELRGLPEIYARGTVALADYPDRVPLKLQALRVGDLGIAAVPCEVFTDIGLRIKRESPLKPTFTVSLANGYNGYLPTPEHHKLGGYETWRTRSSYLEVDASPKVERVVLDLLQTVR